MSDNPLWVPVTMFTFANEFLQPWLGHWVTGGVTLTLGWVPQRMCPGTPPWTRHSAIVFSIPAVCGIELSIPLSFPENQSLFRRLHLLITLLLRFSNPQWEAREKCPPPFFSFQSLVYRYVLCPILSCFQCWYLKHISSECQRYFISSAWF